VKDLNARNQNETINFMKSKQHPKMAKARKISGRKFITAAVTAAAAVAACCWVQFGVL